MPVPVFLIAMPWALPLRPSIQTGILKSHLDRVFGDSVETSCLSAFLAIPGVVAGTDYKRFVYHTQGYGEHPYMLAFHHRFGLPGVTLSDARQTRFLADLKSQAMINITPAGSPSLETIRTLDAATIAVLERDLIPKLSRERLNIVGFTLNYDQSYASLFAARYL
ncbi:MAG: hypothetical protein HQL50_12460, partial [Magnetococcales bacterium]|nr:hypothetical protein [Magnetococcales bacterium]